MFCSCPLRFSISSSSPIDRRGRSYVQASPVPTHSHDGQYLRVCKYIVVPGFTDTEVARTARYCPGGPDSDFDYSTQSYTGYEPTSMRAIRARYDPYEQTRGRVEQLKALGHSVDKVLDYLYLGSHRSNSLSGRVHYHGRDVYEHARGLQEYFRRSAPQRSVRVHRD